MSKILITGFEPFDGYSLNPSAEIAKALNGYENGDSSVIGAVLPLDYENAMEEFDKIIKKTNPEIVLCCGQANRATVTIERIAINAIGIKRPDNYDNIPESDIIDPEGPVAYFSNIDPHPLVEALSEQGIPASVSYHAGIYGCNWLLYKVMRLIDTGKLNARATFVHVPPLPSQAIEKDSPSLATMTLDMLVRALEIIIEQL
ncbi:MAG: pyroglutamyl-peptidase I [Candidatus Hodarchaeota archaeon]